MVKYLLYLPINILFMLICYLFNPIIILFTRSDGTLPTQLRWFQTHDHVLFFDDSWVLSHWPYLMDIEPEWLKLYLCRLFWLYRNTGYTFAYEICGMDLNTNWVVYKDTIKTNGYYFSYDPTKPWYSRGWCFSTSYIWCKWFYLDIYLGWKQRTMNINGRTMIAMRINPLKGN